MKRLAVEPPGGAYGALGGAEHYAGRWRWLAGTIIANWLFRVMLIVLLANLTACAPTSSQKVEWNGCTVVAFDVRTGGSIIERIFDTPHRFMEHSGNCNIIPEDANASALDGLLGPTIGDIGSKVVIPVVP